LASNADGAARLALLIHHDANPHRRSWLQPFVIASFASYIAITMLAALDLLHMVLWDGPN